MTWSPDREVISVADVLELYPHLGVPHFQRGLVWGNDSVASLLESLFYDTPCGSFVLWDSGANHDHGVSMSNEAPGGIRYLVVDGQQRIRSLRQIFHNEGASDLDETGTSDAEEDERIAAKAWCVNLTQLPEFKDILEPHNREYSLFVYTTRPEKADAKSPLRKNILPLDELLSEGRLCDTSQHIKLRSGKQMSDLSQALPNLRTRARAIGQRRFFVTVKRDTPAEVINLYNRINSGGKRVEVEERAFARLVALYPQTCHHVASIFNKVHDKRATAGASDIDHLRRDDVMKRQKENRFGFKLFIRTFIQVSNYHLCRSTGSQYLSFNVVHGDSFGALVVGNDTSKIEFLWQETEEVLVAIRKLLRDELFCDDLAFLPDTMSLVPVLQMLIQFPGLRESQYQPLLASATLALLLASFDTDDLLGLVATLRDDGEVASGVLPGMLKDLDAAARRKMKSPQTLESASSIQNRYVLLLYSLLRKNRIRDFSYRNVTQTTPLAGQEERLICERCDPEKQHIAPFSCLVDGCGDKDAKRGSNHRFNNIGNITYISADLNHFETGLGKTPIDRSLDSRENLGAHYLLDDEHLGNVGHLYDELKRVLCDQEGSTEELVDRRFESFCKARRHLIAQGFVSWLDELGRRSEAVMRAEDTRGQASRVEAIIPRCVDRRSLPLTQQIRSMGYPNDVEDALVGYARQIEKQHDLRKRTKCLGDGYELRLSDGAAVRLLLSVSEIRLDYHNWVTSDVSAPVDAVFGVSAKDRCLYQRSRGGTITLDQLNKASLASQKIDPLKKQQRALVRKQKVNCDPTFAAVIDAYNRTVEGQWQARGNGRVYRLIYPDQWPDAVHFEFLNYDDNIFVDLHLESEGVRHLGSHLAPFSGREVSPGVFVEWDPTHSCRRGCLSASVSKSRCPEIAVQAMNKLIALTRNVIEQNVTLKKERQ